VHQLDNKVLDGIYIQLIAPVTLVSLHLMELM